MGKLNGSQSGIDTAKERFVIITGTPGVGKSTVSSLLESRIGAKMISIGQLLQRERLYIEIDEKRQTLVADTKKLRKRIQEVTNENDKMVVLEGHFAMDVVPPDMVRRIFVLRRDPRDLRNILEKRQYDKQKTEENLAAEILDVCLYDAVRRCGVEKVCEIDTTTKNADDVVNEIISILNCKKPCQLGLVDWLGKLESEGHLSEYFDF